MKRYKLTMQYDGTNYSGMQIQPNAPTIQEEIQKSLLAILGVDTTIMYSGRTDAGVHALGQVAHFDADTNLTANNLKNILNTKLPQDIKILDAEEVDNDFHSRYDVKKKVYIYKFYSSNVELPLFINREVQVNYELDFYKMKKASAFFVGTHDFSNFKKVSNIEKDNMRTIYYLHITKSQNHYEMEICGNGFLHNMVRIIAGILIDIGRGKMLVKDLKNLFKLDTKPFSLQTMPAHGLYLKNVKY